MPHDSNRMRHHAVICVEEGANDRRLRPMMRDMQRTPQNDDQATPGGEDSTPAHVGGKGLTGGPYAGKSRRRSGRLPAEALITNLGTVIDISIGGMRVVSRTPRAGTVSITFKQYPLPGRLTGTVTWSKRIGFFMREIGVRFENVTPEISAVLTEIASMHRFKRAM
jgi:hypothetical protein